MELKIDKEFENVMNDIHKLSDESFKILEEEIIRDGCRDAIVVDQLGNIVDGHNRWLICNKHNLKFKTIVKDFKDREEVKAWIDEVREVRP